MEKKKENNSRLSDEARKARYDYYRAYRAKNKDKVRQWNKNYWEKKARQASENN